MATPLSPESPTCLVSLIYLRDRFIWAHGWRSNSLSYCDTPYPNPKYLYLDNAAQSDPIYPSATWQVLATRSLSSNPANITSLIFQTLLFNEETKCTTDQTPFSTLLQVPKIFFTSRNTKTCLVIGFMSLIQCPFPIPLSWQLNTEDVANWLLPPFQPHWRQTHLTRTISNSVH